MYVRFAHISTEPVMGVKTPAQTKLFAIMNPNSLKQKSLSVKCSVGVHKNWPLGHGQYTLAGNLGPLVPYVSDAKQNGFDDVLWLLDDFVMEITILNTFFVIQGRYGGIHLVTSVDNGCILPGVIRSSILELKDKIKQDTGMIVEERNISIHELIEAHKESRLIEAIGSSTSSHIQPINKIVYKDYKIELGTDGNSKYVSYLNNLVTDVMTGPDTHEWVTSLKL